LRRKKRDFLESELTPLIDVVFLLLIFFMVSSVFKKEELALLLNLPKAEQGKGSGEQKQKTITIELSKKDIAFNGQKISISELKEKAPGIEKKSLINLRVDGEVQYNRLVEILDLLQKNKLENLSLITIKDK